MSWSHRQLGDVCDVIAGGTPKRSNPSYWEGSIPWVKISDMLQGDITHTDEHISDTGLNNSAAKLLPANTLLISIFATIGRVARIKIPATTNQAIVGVIPKDPSQFDSQYLKYCLEAEAEGLKRVSRGVAQNNINSGVLKILELPIPVKNGKPDIEEQKRIAAILDKADAIRRKRQQALDLTDTFLRSTFLHMFGDPVTNPMGWEVRNSIDLFSEKPRIGTTTPAKGKGYLVVRVGELGAQNIAIEKCGRVELSGKDFNKFNLHQGDTIIARAIGSKKQLGKSSYFDSHEEPIVIDSHVMRLRPDPSVCDPFWFYQLLSLPEGIAILQKAGGETAVQFNINATQASSMQIPLPPRDLQSQFASIARNVTQNKNLQITSSLAAEKLFLALQQKAFKGELGGSHQISFPSASRKKQVNAESYLTALIHSYINLQYDTATIKELATTLTVLAAKEDFTDSYNRHLGQDAQQWLESCNDAVALENVLSVLRRMAQHQWIEVSPQGRIQSLANFKTPKDLVWPMYDMLATLRILSEADSVTDFQSLDIIDLSSIQKQA